METIILTASGGGHYEQLKQLDFLKEKYKIVYVISKSKTNKFQKEVTFVKEFRNQTKILKYIDLLFIIIKSFFILLKYKPRFVISTGAASTYPLCWFQKKIFRKKIVFIESYAKRYSGTKTGEKIYKFADYFIVQWEELLKIYPKAIFGGMIY